MGRYSRIVQEGPTESQDPYRRRQEGRSGGEGNVLAEARGEWCSLKMEEGARGQGIQVTTRSWKGQGNGFPLEPSERASPANVLNSASAVS